MRNWNSYTSPAFHCKYFVASLPMRNWNCSQKRANKVAVKLRAYLWGIETQLPYRMGFVLAYVASLPMRNWNRDIILFRNLKTALLRAYLWGIETRKIVCSKLNAASCEPTYEELKLLYLRWICSRDAVASLPMRNWNSSTVSVILLWFMCCEPTYEELKLYSWSAERKVVFRCEPTYEELKPFHWQLYLWKKALCCEPTYEELKLCLCCPIVIG